MQESLPTYLSMYFLGAEDARAPGYGVTEAMRAALIPVAGGRLGGYGEMGTCMYIWVTIHFCGLTSTGSSMFLTWAADI